MSIVTVRPDKSSWGGTPILIGAVATFHQATSDNNAATGFTLPGTDSSGPGHYVLLGYPAPTIPAGYAIAYIQLRVLFKRNQTLSDNQLYTDIRASAGGSFLGSSYIDPTSASAYVEQVATYVVNLHNLPNSISTDVWTVLQASQADLNVAEVYLDYGVEPLPVPTVTMPEFSGTVSSSLPALNATVVASGAFPGMSYARQWQIASNVGMSTSAQFITETSYATSKGDAINFTGTRLAQGTWYIRARVVDEWGDIGGWSGVHSFTVSHPPAANALWPSGARSVLYDTTPTLSWVFTDPDYPADDYQRAYQVQLWRLAAPGTVLDSGKIESAAGTHTFSSGIDSSWKDNDLRWRIKLWDRDDVASAWSVDHGFFMRDAPVVAITSPASGGVVTVSAPTVTWTASRPYYQWRASIYDGATFLAGTGWQTGSPGSWTPSVPIMSVGPTFTAYVDVIDVFDITGSDANSFTATYVSPPAPGFSINSTSYESGALRLLDWSGVTPTGSFYSWRIYRRVSPTGPWVRLTEITDVGTRTFQDWTAPSQVPVQYAVVQVATSLGVPTESNYVPSATHLGTLRNYILTCPAIPDLNLILWHVTSDTFQDEHEQASQNLPGRGRTWEYGSRFGLTGSLSAEFMDQPTQSAREQRLKLEALRSSGKDVYLLNPFGDVWRVGLSSASVSRVAGTGLHEMTTVDMEYTEISA